MLILYDLFMYQAYPDHDSYWATFDSQGGVDRLGFFFKYMISFSTLKKTSTSN